MDRINEIKNSNLSNEIKKQEISKVNNKISIILKEYNRLHWSVKYYSNSTSISNVTKNNPRLSII